MATEEAAQDKDKAEDAAAVATVDDKDRDEKKM